MNCKVCGKSTYDYVLLTRQDCECKDGGSEMIETDDEGERQMEELIKHIHDPCFNDWEQRFIRDLRDKRYSRLTKHQKAAVTRIYGWLKGEK